MDIAGVSSAAVSSAVSNANPQNAVSIAVAKTAIDAQAQTAAQLIESIPEVKTPDPDSHVGQNIDVHA